MLIHPVLLAGGGGTRLWPLSREHYPKQFLSIAGDMSLLQQSLDRVNSGFAVADRSIEVAAPLILCNEEHRFLVAEQARQLGCRLSSIILEPVGRNTAPALTVAALTACADGDDPVLVMMPADHVINDLEQFRRAILAGAEQSVAGHIVTFGIVPNKPETGFGYIRTGAVIDAAAGTADIHAIDSFVEKPDQKTAESYLASGDYLWNSGIFMMKASIWLQAIGEFRPDILAACREAYERSQKDGDFMRLDKQFFSDCPSDSVDYAVMEKLTSTESTIKAVVVSLDAGWSDVGSWSGLWDISPHDQNGNVSKGDVCLLDTSNSLVNAESRFVATLGCEDLVIVETADAVLVANKSKAQDVKKIINWMKSEGRNERLMHRRVFRPWGSYEGIDVGERFQVKRITVTPGERLSLQMHHHRAEHWIVVSGTARVTRGDDVFLLSENESTYIPLGVTHRLENPGSIPLELIEVQSGSYLGEDDIVRFEDVYNRN